MTSFAGAMEIARMVADEVKCPPYEFVVSWQRGDELSDPEECGMVTVHARLWRRDADTGVSGWGWSSPYLITDDMSSDTIVKKCFVAARDYAEHELREAFLWRGRRVLGPHVPLTTLWKALGAPAEEEGYMPEERLKVYGKP